ncbi:MAG: DEAD/DEAH box helicase family protein [Nitrososphaeraceae archaeon]
MTFKELRKIVSPQDNSHQKQETATLFANRMLNKPFWMWNIEEHKSADILTNGDCCFNHIIGLPKKNGEDKPFFDYEKILYDRFQQYKHIWIKKATGLGITEFMLRYMAWLCLRNNDLNGTQMCIVTGPRIDLAITLIDRMKKLFTDSGLVSFDSKETVIELNGVHIEAYPAHHLDAMRGLPDVSFILLDEADFFPPGEQQDARDVSERYIAKSNPWIVMVSTPNAPEGLFERIEREPEDTCLYKRLYFDYTYGLDRIYTREEIEKAKASPSFEREYNLKYLGLIGNVFHTKDIDAAIQRGKEYNPDSVVKMCGKSLGIDPAYGSSNFGIVGTQGVDQKIQVFYAEEFERPDYNEMLWLVAKLMQQYGYVRVYIDGANPSFIKSLKRMIGEDEHYEKYTKEQMERYVKYVYSMKVIPVNFATKHKEMLGHTKLLLERGHVAINPKFHKLVTSLSTAVDNEGSLDKQLTSYSDIFDAFRLSLQNYYFREER